MRLQTRMNNSRLCVCRWGEGVLLFCLSICTITHISKTRRDDKEELFCLFVHARVCVMGGYLRTVHLVAAAAQTESHHHQEQQQHPTYGPCDGPDPPLLQKFIITLLPAVVERIVRNTPNSWGMVEDRSLSSKHHDCYQSTGKHQVTAVVASGRQRVWNLL